MSTTWAFQAEDRFPKPLYFKQMTSIGPATTVNPAEAMRFASKEEALRNDPSFSLLFFTPVELPRAVAGESQ